MKMEMPWVPRGICSKTRSARSWPPVIRSTLGCEDLIIVHTPDATLVCRADLAENIKEVHRLVGEKLGKDIL